MLKFSWIGVYLLHKTFSASLGYKTDITNHLRTYLWYIGRNS